MGCGESCGLMDVIGGGVYVCFLRVKENVKFKRGKYKGKKSIVFVVHMMGVAVGCSEICGGLLVLIRGCCVCIYILFVKENVQLKRRKYKGEN